MSTKQQQEAGWDKAKKIPGRDPDMYRKDPYGDEMHRDSCGKTTQHGWEIDQIKPSSRDGSDHITNLQALNTKKNMQKADSLVKKSRYSKGNK